MCLSQFKICRSVNFLVTGNLWDPWTKPWNLFLDIFGEDKYNLYVFGKDRYIYLYNIY